MVVRARDPRFMDIDYPAFDSCVAAVGFGLLLHDDIWVWSRSCTTTNNRARRSSVCDDAGVKSHTVVIPEVQGTVTLEEQGMFRPVRLLVDGKPAHAVDRGQYMLPGKHGVTLTVKLAPSFAQVLPVLVVNGTRYPVGPDLNPGYVVLIFAPMVLVFLGGLIGGLCGGLAAGLNSEIARSQLAAPLKVLAMLAAGAAAVGVWLAVVGLILG